MADNQIDLEEIPSNMHEMAKAMNVAKLLRQECARHPFESFSTKSKTTGAE